MSSKFARVKAARAADFGDLLLTNFTEKQFSVCLAVFEVLRARQGSYAPTDKHLLSIYQPREGEIAIVIHVDGEEGQSFKSAETLINIDRGGTASVWIEVVPVKYGYPFLGFHAYHLVMDNSTKLASGRASAWLLKESYFQKWTKDLMGAFRINTDDIRSFESGEAEPPVEDRFHIDSFGEFFRR